MEREDIIGGLKSALVRGYSLKDAMVSFFNAGYAREDIEDAAKKLQHQMVENPELREMLSTTNEKEILPENVIAEKGAKIPKAIPGHGVNAIEEIPGEKERGAAILLKGPNAKKAVRGSSGYKMLTLPERQENAIRKGEVPVYEPGTSMRVITIVLIVLLVILMGSLAAIFIFKAQIIQFFNHLLT